jgi:uncharacterized membrane-anchored protein YitT (DUF2179 family)
MPKFSAKNTIIIIVAHLITTFAHVMITVPNEILNGGATSLGLILSTSFGVRLDILVIIFTAMMLTVCWVGLGKEYFFNSLLGSLSYTVFFTVLSAWKIRLPIHPYVAVGAGAVLAAIGYFLCFIARSSTVSFDVIALIIHKHNEKISAAIVLRIINMAILIVGFFVFGLEKVVMGVIFILIQTELLKQGLKYYEKYRTKQKEKEAEVCEK